MLLRKKFEITVLLIAFLFSWWLMFKSFRYDAALHQFQIGRNEVGDFGLHLGLIRSFSWGDNLPPESPFYPGSPLPYHYFFDLTAGFLERSGLRIDFAVNGLSGVAFTLLMIIIYKLSQLIFGKSIILGLTSVLLFIFPSSLTFLDFFKNKTLNLTLIKQIWLLPDYINKGPFDSSPISIYFTPAVYLNQRHLIVGLVIGLGIIYFVLRKILMKGSISSLRLALLGLILGVSSRVHSLIAVATAIVLLSLLLLFKRFRWIIPFTVSTVIGAIIMYYNVFEQMNVSRSFIYFGFLSARPVTLTNFFTYWWANLWLAAILVPLGFFMSGVRQKKIFLSFFLLFVIANVFQLSFRIEHNHSFFNYFLIVVNCYTAFVLTKVWEKNITGKAIYIVLLLVLTFSGLLNLMAVKNDFQYSVKDAPANALMEWIKNNTDKRAVFLSKQDLYDPVVLSGRKNYFGATYYLLVMGYDFGRRQQLTRVFFESSDPQTFKLMKQEGINYIVIPIKPVDDFPYVVHREFFKKNLLLDYSDENVEVFRL